MVVSFCCFAHTNLHNYTFFAICGFHYRVTTTFFPTLFSLKVQPPVNYDFQTLNFYSLGNRHGSPWNLNLRCGNSIFVVRSSTICRIRSSTPTSPSIKGKWFMYSYTLSLPNNTSLLCAAQHTFMYVCNRNKLRKICNPLQTQFYNFPASLNHRAHTRSLSNDFWIHSYYASVEVS
jgi:hypothetical protein